MNRRDFIKTCGGVSLCCGLAAAAGMGTSALKSLATNAAENQAKLPTSFRIDACTLCQLNCERCIMRTMPDQVITGKGYLKFKDFKNFVDNNTVKHVELSAWGEIFLNPELLDIIKYAHEKDVKLTAYTGVNFNTVSDEALEALVKYNFQGMSVSIDGASQETYSIYRRGGDFDKVIDNIKKVNAYKAKYKSIYPNMCWKMILFGHNQYDIPKAKLMANELNMAFAFSTNYAQDYSPLTDMEFVKKEMNPLANSNFVNKTIIPLLSNHNSKLVSKATPLLAKMPGFVINNSDLEWRLKNSCAHLWNSPQINWDGRLLGCCNNFFSDGYGVNAFQQELTDVLNSSKFIYAKKMIANQAPERDDIPCSNCWVYKEMKQNDIWFKT